MATTVGYEDIRLANREARFVAVIIALVSLIYFGDIAPIAVHVTTIAVQMHADLTDIQSITN